MEVVKQLRFKSLPCVYIATLCMGDQTSTLMQIRDHIRKDLKDLFPGELAGEEDLMSYAWGNVDHTEGKYIDEESSIVFEEWVQIKEANKANPACRRCKCETFQTIFQGARACSLMRYAEKFGFGSVGF
ncbi:uncharacterized protein LOC114717378 [Neltuma alba]|uniref:uncharacterized protein LOC114717378 n=1 Tax=Neltuma alba TaxID=207710 RepID=UPI0010A35117|nr:uncharacterized protein LOC114717378 [Prosopis alba]